MGTVTKRQWQFELWINSGDPTPTSTILYSETQAALKPTVRAWLQEHQPQWFSVSPVIEQRPSHNEVACFYQDTPLGQSDWRATKATEAERLEIAQAHPWCIHDVHIGRVRRVEQFQEALDWFVSYVAPSKGPDFVNGVLDEHGHLDEQRIRNVKDFEPTAVNNALARGWHILRIDQRTTQVDGTVTVFVMAHAEEGVQ